MDEAMNPLTILCFGLYGEVLPNQNGSPIRTIIPWKYGFKSTKAIVKIRFMEKQPDTAWNKANAHEYGFYSNVNPEVDHPRWSQATERRLGEFSNARRSCSTATAIRSPACTQEWTCERITNRVQANRWSNAVVAPHQVDQATRVFAVPCASGKPGVEGLSRRAGRESNRVHYALHGYLDARVPVHHPDDYAAAQAVE